MNDKTLITLVIDQQASSPSWIVVLGHDDPVYVHKTPEVGDTLELGGVGNTKVDEVEQWEEGNSRRDFLVSITPWQGSDDELEAHVARMCEHGWYEDDRAPARDDDASGQVVIEGDAG